MKQPLLHTIIKTVVATFLFAAPWAWGQGTTGDRISVPLTDPSRPSQVKVSLVSGGITVKGYEGKEVVVEAHARGRDAGASEGGMKRVYFTADRKSVLCFFKDKSAGSDPNRMARLLRRMLASGRHEHPVCE